MKRPKTYEPFPEKTRLLRVTSKRKCPICNKPDWCSFTEDESLALCMRVAAGSVKQAANRAYIHVLNPYHIVNTESATSASSIRDDGNCGSVSADKLDAVYRALLQHPLMIESKGSSPPLKPAHAKHLLEERGFSDTTIAANLYTSVQPAEVAQAVCDDLATRFDLKGIPGFFKREGRFQLKAFGDGFFVPYRNVRGEITGMQIRKFDSDGKNKYIWLSTKDEENGTPVKASLHFAKPDLVSVNGFAYITEGALKADRISEFTDKACIAIPGVSAINPESLTKQLRLDLPDLVAVEVVFDTNFHSNSSVRAALISLKRELDKTPLELGFRVWNPELGKGFDDFLFNQKPDNEKG